MKNRNGHKQSQSMFTCLLLLEEYVVVLKYFEDNLCFKTPSSKKNYTNPFTKVPDLFVNQKWNGKLI